MLFQIIPWRQGCECSRFCPVSLADEMTANFIALLLDRSMDRVDEKVLNYDLIEDVLMALLGRVNCPFPLPEGGSPSRGGVLIFLPGLGEIRSLIERLNGSRHFSNKDKFEIIPMHSTLSSRDQRRLFQPSPTGCRKIIIATNIAETRSVSRSRS